MWLSKKKNKIKLKETKRKKNQQKDQKKTLDSFGQNNVHTDKIYIIGSHNDSAQATTFLVFKNMRRLRIETNGSEARHKKKHEKIATF